MRKLAWAPVVALLAGLLTLLTPAAASADAGDVRNTGGYAIGAVQFRDGVYKVPGKYDDLIPPGYLSGYPTTAGIYVGPGYCVRFRYWINGNPNNLSDPAIFRADATVFPNGRHLWFENGSWDVRALPLSDSGCWNP